MSFQVHDNAKLPIAYAATDAEGNPVATPAGAITFTVVPPEMGTVETPDTTKPLEINFRPADTAGHLGDCQLQGSFAPSDGTAAIPVDPVAITVLAGAVHSLSPAVGAEIPK